MSEAGLVVLFVGGPLHGTSHEWTNPPDYHPHVTATGMVPYSRRELSAKPKGVDAVYAPVGMTHAAISESLAHLSME